MKTVCAPGKEGEPKGLHVRNNSKLLGLLYKPLSLLSTNNWQRYRLLTKLGFCSAFMLSAICTTAQVLIQTQPAAVSNCQPISSTGYNLLVAVRKGSCGNINTNNVGVVWQFSSNNSTWTDVTAGSPAGYSYSSVNSDGGGSGGNAIVNNTLNVTVASPFTAGQYYYRAIITGPSCVAINSNVASFLIKARPVPTFTAQPGATACINQDVTYTTQSGAGETGYLWNIPGSLGTDYTISSGGIGLTNPTVTLKWLTTGAKIVTVNYTNANGCSAASPTSSVSTNVSSLPNPTFTAEATATSCAGTDVTYTTQGGQTNYVWTFPGTAGVDYSITSGGTSSSNTVTLKWLTTGSKTVGINYSTGAGCSATAAKFSNPTTVTSRPTPTFSPVPAASICPGANITYTTQPGQSNYQWTIPGVLNVDYNITNGSVATTSNTVSINWITSGNKAVTVNYGNANGCTGTSPASTSTVVNARPTPTFTASAGASICSNTDVTYTTQAGQSNYIWTIEGTLGTDYSISSGGSGITSNSVTLKWLTPGSKTITVNYSNASGCTAAVAVGSTTNVQARPTPTFTSSPGVTTCANTDVTYTTQPGQSAYTWTVPGSSPADYTILSGGIGANSNTVTLQWKTAGTKVVTINYNNTAGCNALAAESNTTTISIAAVPVVSGSPLSFCEGGNVTLSSTSATSYQWYNDGILIPGATSQNYQATGSGSYNVKVTNSDGCTASSIGTTVTENPNPDITVAAQASSLCFSTGSQTSGLAYTATEASPNTYSITWNNAPGFVNVTNASLPQNSISIAVPAATPAGTYSGSLTVKTADGCTSIAKPFTVKITSPPDLTNFNIATSSGCDNESTITVSSSTIGDGNYTVTYDLAGANNATGNTATMIFSGNSGSFKAITPNTGSTTITITAVALVGCSSQPLAGNTSTFTVNASPAVAAITGSSSICEGETTDLGNTTAGGTWSSSDAAVATVNNTGLVTAVAGGTAVISYETAPNATNCSGKATKNMIVHALPFVAPITGPSAVCINATANLDNANSGGIWESSNTTVATVSNTGLVTPAAQGNTTIKYTSAPNAGGCTSNTTVIIAVDPAPTVTAGTQLETCESASPVAISLSGAGVGGSATSARWAIESGGGTLSNSAATNNPSGVSYIPAANFNGQVILSLTTNAPGSCAAVSAQRVVNVTEKPVIIAGNNITVCESTSPVSIVLSGASVGGSATSAAWSITSGGGSLSSTSQTANPETVIYTPQANFHGDVILALTSSNPGICAAVTSTRTITISQKATVQPGSSVNLCQSATPTGLTLSGASYGGGASSAAWSIISGGGTLSNAGQTGSPQTVSYTPAANFTGTVTLALTSDAPGGCPAVSQEKTIEIAAKSTVDAAGPNTVCQSANPAAFALTGADVAGGATTGAWSIVSGGGSLSSTAQTANPGTIIYTPAANYSGAVSLKLTSNATGTCSPVEALRTVTIAAPPTAIAGTDILSCENSGAVNITPGSSATNYTSVTWETNGTGTFTNVTSLTTATYTPSLADITSGTVTITLRANGGACADATATKNLTITKAATVDAGSPITICSNAGATNITASSTAANYSTIAWTSSGTGTIANANSLTAATYTPGANESGIITLILTANGNTPCANAIATKSLTITALPTANISYTGSSFCKSDTATKTVTLAGSGAYTGGTFTATPAGLALNNTSGSINAAGSSAGTYTVTYTIPASAGCGIVTASTTVTIDPASIGGTLSPAATNSCPNTNSGTITLAGNNAPVLRWEYSTDAGANWTTVGNTSTSLIYSNITQTRLYRAVIQSGVCGFAYSTYSAVGIIPPFPPTPVIATPAAICLGQSSTLTASSGYPVNGIADSSGNFQNANPKGWCRDGQCTGDFLPANGDNTDNGPWRETNPHAFNGINYGSPDPKFAIASGAFNTILETPVFSMIGQTSGMLNFIQGYILNAGSSAVIEISTNGGASYNTVLQQVAGVATLGKTGNTVTMQNASLDLTNYLGLSNLRIRFKYSGSANSAWVIDNVLVPNTALNLVYTWAAPQTLNTTSGTTVVATPTTTTTYTVTTIVGGCPGGTSQVTVTVNPVPTITHNAVNPLCSGVALSPNIQFNSTLTGTTYTYTITNPGGITGLVTNANGTISGTPINPTSTPQTIKFVAAGTTAAGCAGALDSVSIIINPGVQVTLSGDQTICGSTPANLTLTSAGPFPIDVVLSNGITYSVTGSPFQIAVTPSVTTTYSITSLPGGSCAPNGGIAGTATVTVPTAIAPAGTWVCGTSSDWFNPCNWGGGIVPDNNTDVIIPNSSPCSPVIDTSSVYAPADKLARSRNILIGSTQNLAFTDGANLYVAGNWQNDRGPLGLTASTGTVTFMGSTAQTISTVGARETFNNLLIDNSVNGSAGVTLNSPVNVGGVLTLTDGIIRTSTTNLLSVTNPAVTAVVGGANNTYVWGPIARNTNTTADYNYPVGDPASPYGEYRPAITTPQSTSPTTYQAEYKLTPVDPTDIPLDQHGSFLTGILATEHWQIDRPLGTADAIIKLPYVYPPSDTHWDGDLAPCSSCAIAIVTPYGALWDFTGGPDYSGGYTQNESVPYGANILVHSKPMSTFGDFTFGFAFQIILPVKLEAFTGQLVNGDGLLNWRISGAKDLDGFELEYSRDGRKFSTLVKIAPVAGASNYSYQHKQLPAGSNYYR
ncbi:MAG: Ig-like domain-containing protein, partial [Bacteroidota bacterium]